MEEKKKRGRPKKTTTRKIISNTKAKVIKDQHGDDHILVVEEQTFYTFVNRRLGPLFFKRETGKEDMFKGHETKKDITEKERELLLNTKDYANGWIVEEFEKEEINEETIWNKNAVSDSRLSDFIDKNKKSIENIQNFISGMTSNFALNKMKDLLIAKDMPSSVVLFCDYRIKQLEEEYLEKQKAPIPGEIDE